MSSKRKSKNVGEKNTILQFVVKKKPSFQNESVSQQSNNNIFDFINKKITDQVQKSVNSSEIIDEGVDVQIK